MRYLSLMVLALTLAGCRKDKLPTEPQFISHVFGRVRSCWTQPQVLYPWSQPAVNGNMVIFATGDRRLIARDRATGTILWNTQITSENNVGRVSGLNLIQRSGVVVAAVSRNTVGLDVTTGAELWSYGAPPDTLTDGPGRPAAVEGVGLEADDETVYVPAWGASVSAVDIRTGQARWIWRPAPGTQFRSGGQGARLSGDTLFVTVWHHLNELGTNTEGWVVALDRRDGRELGRTVIPPYTFGNVFRGSPAVWNHLVIVTGPGGRVWAIDRTTYALAWQYAPAAAVGTTLAGPELYGDVVYTDGGDERALALRAGDGTILWSSRLMSQATANFHATETRVYIPESGFLNILDRQTGRYVARTEQRPPTLSGSLFPSAVNTAGTQVFISVNGAAWCFERP